LVLGQAPVKLRPDPICRDALARLQQSSTEIMRTKGASQSKHDIYASCSNDTSARAKGFPIADLQICLVDPSNAAISADVSEAQKAEFAKPGTVTEADIRINIEVGSFEPIAGVAIWLGCCNCIWLPTAQSRHGSET
jgi:hypothetical protein